MKTREKLIEERRKYLESKANDWVSARVEKDIRQLLIRNPVPDEDEEGLYAVQRHEDWINEQREKSEEYWSVKYDEEILPEALERYEMQLEVED